MHIWQVQEAKMKLSELIREARNEPQIISSRGEEVVVVLSKEEYNQLKKPKLSIIEIMQKSPAKEMKLDFARSNDNKLRKIEL